MDRKTASGHRLGGDIEIYCRYCKLNLDGVVASFAEDKTIAKVQCRTCMHFQDYKPPVDMEEKHRKLVAKAMRIADRHTRGQGGRSERKESAQVSEDLSQEAVMRRMWDEATADVSPMKAKVYDRHRSYSKDDVILHKVNGMGVVVRDDVEYSMTVLFRDVVVELERDIPRED